MTSVTELTIQIDDLVAQASQIYRENPKKAIVLARQAQTLSQSALFFAEPYQRGLAGSMAELAKAYSILGDYAQAIEMGSKALELAQELGNLSIQSCSLEALGIAYRDLGDFASALETQLHRLELARQSASPLEESHALNRLGSIYSHMGQYEKALEQYKIALPIYEAAGDTIGQARIHHNSSIEYRELGRFDDALKHGLLSLKLYAESDDTKRETRTYQIVARVYGHLGKYDEALQHCQNALDLVQDEGNSFNLMNALITYGRIYAQMNELNEAIPYFEQALSIAEELQTPEYLHECHEDLSNIYKKQGDFQKALDHYEQFHSIKESVFNAASTNKVKSLEILHYTRETQKELEQQQKLRDEDRQYFERLTKMKDEVLRSVSHDLKNPLSSILTSTYLLKRHGNTVDEQGSELLQRIEYSVEQMRQLISDILDLARLDTGRGLQFEMLHLAPLVQTIIDNHRPMAENRNITFDFEQSAHDIAIKGDAQLIKRAVSNLLSNAIKYTGLEGHIEIMLAYHEQGTLISIKDNGIGISQDDLAHIFEHFYRVDNASTSDIEGTGLGLSIVKSIIEQHGGHIRVESTLNVGSSFSFILPIVEQVSV
jgi:two-component system, sensor histidine kinase ChiS